MKTTLDFIAAVKTKRGIESDYAVAKILNVTNTALSSYRNGKSHFSDEIALRVADELEIDPAYVVACIHAERAKREEEKKLWERIANMTAGITALLVIAALPWDESSAFVQAGMTSDAPALYIMSNLASAKLVILALAAMLYFSFPRYTSSPKN